MEKFEVRKLVRITPQGDGMDPHRGAVPVAASAIKLLPSRLQWLRESVLLSQLPEHVDDAAAVASIGLRDKLFGESLGQVRFAQAFLLCERVCQLPRHSRIVRIEVVTAQRRLRVHLELPKYPPLGQRALSPG